jgi:hypothetical protein
MERVTGAGPESVELGFFNDGGEHRVLHFDPLLVDAKAVDFNSCKSPNSFVSAQSTKVLGIPVDSTYLG